MKLLFNDIQVPDFIKEMLGEYNYCRKTNLNLDSDSEDVNSMFQ